MAISGSNPIILFGLIDVLTTAESDLLKKLSAATNKNRTAADIAAIDALKAKSTNTAVISAATLARVPIILDGELVPATVEGYSMTMVKTLSVFEGANTVTQAANTVTVRIKTSSSVENKIFLELLFSIADIIFSKSDIAPSISYFGGEVAIPNGYLVRMTRQASSTSTEEFVTLEIAKDLSFLFGEAQEFNTLPAATPVEVVPSSGEWVSNTGGAVVNG